MYGYRVRIFDEEITRFMSLLDISEDPEGCWLWTRSTGTHGGHGRICIGGVFWVAHRFAWTVENGAIPDGVQIWSTCRVDRCVRPSHHEAVTDAEARERVRQASLLARPTCKYGHKWTPENTRIRRGLKECRTCGRDWQRARRAAKR